MINKFLNISFIFFLLLGIFLISGCDDFNLLEILANDISLVPEEITLDLDETVKFAVSAGIAPFVFTEVGDGNVPDGIYTAPSVPGTFTISVEDDRNRKAEAYITVVDAVSLSPNIVSTGLGGIIFFTISGGTAPHSVEMDLSLGTLSSLTYDPGPDVYYFSYTAESAGMETIRIIDFLDQITEAYITINSNSELQIIPEVVEVVIDDTFQFSASGGVSAYTYTLETAVRIGEDFVTGTRMYTAPSLEGTPAIVRVTDSDTPASISEATVYIVAELFTINPSVALTLYVGDEFIFSASNGTSPYSFSILPGDEPSGSINSGTGLFTALAKDNSVTVIVTDDNNNTSTCRVKIKN